jgi:hypothetical protein
MKHIYIFQHFKNLNKVLKLFKHHNVLSNFIVSIKFLFIYKFLFNSLNVMIYKILNCMTKYFDKLLKIKLYNICYPSHGNMKNNVILGHVDFF